MRNASLNNEDSMASEKLVSEKVIKINTISLENIRLKDYPITIHISVEYGGRKLASIPSVLVEKQDVTIDYTAYLTIDVNDCEELDGLAGIPITFDIEEVTGKDKKGVKDGKMKFGGKCYLDLLPFLLGETAIGDQPLVVEVVTCNVGQDMVPWTYLPLLHARAEVDEALIPKDVLQESNILFFTLESMYNITPDLPSNFTYTAGIEIPVDETYGTIEFKSGILDTKKDVENMKNWHGLPFLPGRNAFTKQRISEDHHEIRNYTGNKIDFTKFLKGNSPHVRWNTIKRCFMTATATQEFKRKLFKTNCFSMEFLVESLEEKANDKSKQKKTKEPEQTAVLHMASYLNLCGLLHPGVSRIRLASPVVNFNAEEHSERSDNGKPIFDVTVESPAPYKEDTSEKDRAKSKKSKSEKPVFDPQCVLEGKLFVIVEVEFLHPLIPETPQRYLWKRINEMIPERQDLQLMLRSKKLSEETFKQCIKVLHGKLHHEYCNFIKHIKQSGCKICTAPFATGRDMLPAFTHYLRNTGNCLLIEETLKSHVINIFRLRLNEKMKKGTMLDIMRETQDLFIYMVKVMRQAVNSHVEGRHFISSPKECVNSEMMAYFAFEALEEGRHEEAKKWLLKRLNSSTLDLDAWFDFALFHLRIGETDEATICLKRVLEVDKKHFHSLLLYAMILTEKQCYSQAKIFFQALMKIYVNYQEVLVAFNIFFIFTEDKIGQEEVMRKVTRSKLTSIDWPIKQYLLMSWRDMEISSPFLQAASLFLKICALKFAEMALVLELAHTQDVASVSYTYYTAVLSYMKGDFHEADSHLEKIIPETEDYRPWSLAGHVSHQLGRGKKALSSFKYVIHCLHPPPDFHMLYLRAGLLYNSKGQYHLASDLFINACKHYGTPYTWQMAGRAAYESGDYESAELSLSESNMLDKYDPNTWAALALVNIALKRKEAFHFCYKQAHILKSDDEGIEEKISQMTGEMFPEETDSFCK